MRLWQDGLIAMLAAVGLAAILWMVLGLFFRRRRRLFSRVTAVVRGEGDGEDLEYTVRVLSQLRYERGAFGTILILDCGLSGEGQALAALLAREEEHIALCRREDAPDYFQ